MYFWFGRFRASIAPKPAAPIDTNDYHALRYAQEMAMVRSARSAAAADAHALLAEAHRRAADAAPATTGVSSSGVQIPSNPTGARSLMTDKDI